MDTPRDKELIPVDSPGSMYRGNGKHYALVTEGNGFSRRILFVAMVERNRRSLGYIEFLNGKQLRTRSMTVDGVPVQVFMGTPVLRGLWEMQQWRSRIQHWADDCPDASALRAVAELVGETGGADWQATIPTPAPAAAPQSWRDYARDSTRDWLKRNLWSLGLSDLRAVADLLSIDTRPSESSDQPELPVAAAA